MIEGRTVNIGGTDYTVPPFPMKLIRLHPEWIRSVRSIEDIPTAEQTEAIVGIIHSAIARNYPDVSMEALEDALDIRTALEALAAVMDVSGMQRVKPGDKSGEAEPVS